MSANTVFQMESASGWRRGLNNLMNAELRGWWGTSTWWVQALIWTLVLGGLTAGVALSGQQPDFSETIMIYALFAGMFTNISVIIVMQDALVGEKQNGTAAWILSKPVSRKAFIVSKLLPNWIGFVVTILIIPSLVVFVILRSAYGQQADPLRFLAAIGVLSIVLLFFQTLTLMLGAFFNHRGPVIGIALALLFMQQYLVQMLPILGNVLPWRVILPVDAPETAIVPAILNGVTPENWTPVLSLLVLSAIFIAVTIWRFDREEF